MLIPLTHRWTPLVECVCLCVVTLNLEHIHFLAKGHFSMVSGFIFGDSILVFSLGSLHNHHTILLRNNALFWFQDYSIIAFYWVSVQNSSLSFSCGLLAEKVTAVFCSVCCLGDLQQKRVSSHLMSVYIMLSARAEGVWDQIWQPKKWAAQSITGFVCECMFVCPGLCVCACV